MSTRSLKIRLAQLNPTVGDIVANAEKIRETYLDAAEEGIKLVVAPELALSGCPLEQLALHPDLYDVTDAALDSLARASKDADAALLVGAPYSDVDGEWSALILVSHGEWLVAARSPLHPTIDQCGCYEAGLIQVGGIHVGVLPGGAARDSASVQALTADGAELLVCMTAEPFIPGNLERRVRDIAANRVAEAKIPLVLVNLVGGQDELVYDGGSFCMDGQGRLAARVPQWEECVGDWDMAAPFAPDDSVVFPEPLEEMWQAMVLALRDYARKSGFADVMLGLSGGLDSALVAAVAGDALGGGHVHCFRLPGQYTSDLSNSSAAEMCGIWGFSMDTVAIASLVEAGAESLSSAMPDGLKKLTRENMQARARGFLLMTVSNEKGWLLLSTGNKSEIAAGYATLYGDMCGGFNPIKDVFKTTAFSLSKWRNGNLPCGALGPEGVVIPVEIIERPPTAELSPGQLDSDSLPAYPILDAILEDMLEHHLSRAAIVEKGFDPAVVVRVEKLLRFAEYKRRQGAPGPAMSRSAFTFKHLPIVNRFVVDMAEELR